MVTITPTALAEVKVIASKVFQDERGHLIEAANERDLAAAGIAARFVQDNLVHSGRGVLRGLHFQKAKPQGKLVRAVTGSIFDVAVDIRRRSKSLGKWVAVTLVAGDGRALWIPPGFAHGYLVLSETADVYYKCTDFYSPDDERLVRWDDPAIGIEWPVVALGLARGAPVTPILAPRDAAAPLLADADLSK